ncbi:MAG: hypothetical protein EA361_17565 [Bacteroidetes bacterium]|nr:MAG: hypothetical protein EA361_17565 [Bacteroidota bacterium]
MQTLNIKTHRKGRSYENPHFFILNKGLNSGKPLRQPCANCFVIQFSDIDTMEKTFWMIFGLWRSKSFHPLLRGSVIPFINLDDLKACISQAITTLSRNPDQFHKNVKTLRSLEELEKQYKTNLLLIESARKAIFYQCIVKR